MILCELHVLFWWYYSVSCVLECVCVCVSSGMYPCVHVHNSKGFTSALICEHFCKTFTGI